MVKLYYPLFGFIQLSVISMLSLTILGDRKGDRKGDRAFYQMGDRIYPPCNPNLSPSFLNHIKELDSKADRG